MSDDLLAIYLTDHLAGATGGSNRMRSLADHERSASDGAVLATIASEIEQDRRTLIRILAAAQVTPRRYKMAAAWLVERAGLLKSNGSFRRSPLTSVLELEFLRMGVTGKIALWESLRQTDLRDEFDFDELLAARHSTPAGTRGRPRSPRVHRRPTICRPARRGSERPDLTIHPFGRSPLLQRFTVKRRGDRRGRSGSAV